MPKPKTLSPSPIRNVTGPRLAKLFEQLESRAGQLNALLQSEQELKRWVRMARPRVLRFGRALQAFARVNLTQPRTAPLLDPVVPQARCHDGYIWLVGKIHAKCVYLFRDTRTMQPEARLRFLRRRLWLNGRRLELISIAPIIDREALVRFIVEGEKALAEQKARSAASKSKVVAIAPAAAHGRVVAEDEVQAGNTRTKRLILNLAGAQRIAFDLTSRVTELPPGTGDTPAPVLPVNGPKRKLRKKARR